MTFQSQIARSPAKKKPETLKAKPLSPFAHFNTTMSSKEEKRSAFGQIQLNVQIGQFQFVHFNNGLLRETNGYHQKRSLGMYSGKNSLCCCLQCFASEVRKVKFNT